MRGKRTFFILIFTIIIEILDFSSGVYLFAGEEGVSNVFNQRINLDLRDMDLTEAFRFIAEKVGLNIVATKNVRGRISLTVEDVPVKDIFDIILRSNKLAYDKRGEIYNIMTEEEYKALYGKNFSDPRLVKVFRLKYAIPQQAFSLLDALKSDIGRILVDPESGNVLIMDTSQKIEEMRKALEEFEKKNLVKVFTLKYANAIDVEETLKTQLDMKKVGSIKADERTNQIIVQTLPERMKEIERLIKGLDKQTKEVVIDTKIIKIKLSDKLDSGIEWEGIFGFARRFGLAYVGSYPFSVVQTSTDTFKSREQFFTNVMGGTAGAIPFSGTTTNFSASSKVSPGEKIHIGLFDAKRDFDVLFKFLQTLGETRILSNPKIVAVNNKEAKIHIGERQAYVTTTTTTGQTTSTISEEVQFVDVGIQLSVIPTISDDGYITMKVKPEISSVISVLVTPTNNRIPIIDTSMAETTVMVKNGTTLIIGGLRKEEKTGEEEKFPILGDIPFLGHLFKNSTSKIERTELLVLLTPHIITGRKLTTGDERVFGHIPGKGYRDYESLSSERELYLKEVPPQLKPKGYRNIKGYRELSSIIGSISGEPKSKIKVQ